MNSSIPFLVGAGHLSEEEMSIGSLALSSAWGGGLIKHNCEDKPHAVLNNLPSKKVLVQLNGDVARLDEAGDSWIQSLADWRQPVLLMATTQSEGVVPGVVPAYSALCSALSVRLIGIVQIGGSWNAKSRCSDGLAWLGCIASHASLANKQEDSLAKEPTMPHL